MTLREYLTAHLPNLEVPAFFRHVAPDKPTGVVFPGALTEAEQAEVNAWKAAKTEPTLPDAVAKVEEIVAYRNASKAWELADHLARIVQYRIAFSDAIIANKPATSRSADIAGEGSVPPPAVVTRTDA
jgi:hypothetical protein